jgi:hypothetical protein
LRRCLSDPDFVMPRLDRLAAEVPPELWRDASLAVLRALAAVANENSRDAPLGLPRLRALVATGPLATADLQQEMAATRVPKWRSTIAWALRDRGANAAPTTVRTDDPLWPFWSRALALAHDDAAGALALLGELQGQKSPQRLDLEVELLEPLLGPPLAAAGTPAQLYAGRRAMTTDGWRTAWARLDSGARVALIDRFQKSVYPAFVPATEVEAEALWRFLQRGRDLDAVIAATDSLVGIKCLQRHLAAGDAAADTAAVRKAFAEQLGLEPDTLSPAPGAEVRALALRLRHVGLAGATTPAERDQLAAILALRGFAPLHGR